MTSFRFRNSPEPEDVANIERIVVSSGFFRPDEVAVAVELVNEALEKGQQASGYHFIFCMEDKQTIGFCCFGPTPCTLGTWDLYWIAVEERYRGQKIGKQLLEKAESYLRQENSRKLYIETSSLTKYLPTRKFYLKSGYTEEACLKDFYDTGDDKIIYCRYL